MYDPNEFKPVVPSTPIYTPPYTPSASTVTDLINQAGAAQQLQQTVANVQPTFHPEPVVPPPASGANRW